MIIKIQLHIIQIILGNKMYKIYYKEKIYTKIHPEINIMIIYISRK